ncbi:Protein-glutamate methylesterase/protein-glutamine glutaminase [Dyadobacter sp. CECT 9623]|uniref:protein-glutamate methylesterase n=1 Tax=Dyadobacter linearis TaxID=2823330 RepID=A0ABM8USK4_9BACT|nr:chemotaxis protein CheB [Dyadobacter sp. CECT 9623]CAG5070682.1 Protein-glutamate methylesterase/protein-glutamine glutaminase [Dyadobacter sp. CECT 9623]
MNMHARDIVVIGSSAGGVIALKELVKSFDKDLAASVFVVQHLAADHVSYLPQILSNHGPLPALQPQDGEEIRKGVVYVAPPDHHMIIENGRILIKKGPKENNFRPSIDALMRSAAYWYGSRVMAVVLTGYLNDGSSGLWSVAQFGGLTMVQSPQDALHPDMPNNALEYVDADYNMPLKEIGPIINQLVGQPVGLTQIENNLLKERIKAEIEVAAQKNALLKGINKMGEKTDLTCPDCGGVLTGFEEGSKIRYRCHTGHAFSQGALWSGITDLVETKLWQAMRAMEEGILFLEQAVTRSELSENLTDARSFEIKAEILRDRSKALLNYIYNQGQLTDIKIP